MARAADVTFEEDAGIAEVASPSRATVAKPCRTASSSSHTRMPMPPPPAVAFSMTG
jgi:hypothetical protein